MRPTKAVTVFAITAAIATSACADTNTINFDDLKTGGPPAGWTAAQTGTGKAKWMVQGDAGAPTKPNVLTQSGEATYPICLKNDTSLKDGFIEVKFKPIAGLDDQAGGVIWRAKDSDNYYVASANAMGNTVCIYSTVKGECTEWKRTSMDVGFGEWNTLRVDFQGSHFTVTFNGKKAIEWDDASFKDAGKVGVWTSADSEIRFDDFRYGENKK